MSTVCSHTQKLFLIQKMFAKSIISQLWQVDSLLSVLEPVNHAVVDENRSITRYCRGFVTMLKAQHHLLSNVILHLHNNTIINVL